MSKKSNNNNFEIVQQQENPQIVQNQQQLNLSIDYDQTLIQQLQQQYENKIKDYFKNSEQEVMKKQVKKFVQDQFTTFILDVEKIFKKQCDKFKFEQESFIKQTNNLISEHQQEKNKLQCEIQELNKKFNEANNQLIMSTYKDENVCSKINQMSQIMQMTLEKTNQASEQLESKYLDQMTEQIQKIKQTITGDTETQINQLQVQLKEKEKKIEQLEKKILENQNQIENNKSSVILMKKLEELIENYQNQFNQVGEIKQKTNLIEDINKELKQINAFLIQENKKLKEKLEHEKNLEIQKQLEGCYKLQDRSLLYIQLGLKIFQQYSKFYIQDDKKIKTQIDKLNTFHQNYQKKENFKLKTLQDVENFYNKQEKELKLLYEDSLKEYKSLINEITQRRVGNQ